MVYKQTILPHVDYVGFILLSYRPYLGVLQILRNNALGFCLRYRLANRVRIEDLHFEAKLQSVEQRSTFQLFKLLYSYSKDASHLKTLVQLTRGGTKIMFVLPSKCDDKILE